MPRRAAATKRPVEPDPVHRSRLVQQVINRVMLDGKKSTAERIVYDALAIIAERTGKDPVEFLEESLKSLTPSLEVKPNRSTTLALRWLVGYSQARREKTMSERLMNEILDASNGLGAAVKRREDMHKMAESNKAFAHYRW